MDKKKTDFQRFCETMWIMVKYDALPWLLAIGLCTAVTLGVMDAKENDLSQKTIPSIFQKQR